jgi:hypothetical protein
MIDLPDVKDMTKEQFQKALKVLAFGCGIEKYKQEHPGASGHEAEEWAYDNWKQFKEQSYFFLVAIALREEIAEECKWN